MKKDFKIVNLDIENDEEFNGNINEKALGEDYSDIEYSEEYIENGFTDYKTGEEYIGEIDYSKEQLYENGTVEVYDENAECYEEGVEYIENENVEYCDEDVEYIDDENVEYYEEDAEYIDDENAEYYEDGIVAENGEVEYLESEELDEEYDDEEYDDEEFDDDDDGVPVREKSDNKFVMFIKKLKPVDYVAASIALLIIAVAVFAGVKYGEKKNVQNMNAQLAAVGTQYASLGQIGSDGLIGLCSVARNSFTEVETTEDTDGITVAVSCVSLSKDIKVKFFHDGSLVSDKEFEITLESVDGGEPIVLVDDDKDGMIYNTDMTPGDYTLTVSEMDGIDFIPCEMDVTVKGELEYNAIDVSDEVQVATADILATEDVAVKEVEEEDLLVDTVEWVESTREAVDGSDGYTQIDKNQVKNPADMSKLDDTMDVINEYLATDVRPYSVITGGVILRDNTPSGNNAGEPDATPTPSPEATATPSPDPTASPTATPTPTPTPSANPAGTTTVTVTAETDTLYTTGTTVCTAKVSTNGQDVSSPSVTWSSSDTSLATVGSDGKVTAVKEGSVTITASYKTSSGTIVTGTKSFTIKKDEPSGIVLVGGVDVKTGETTTITATGQYLSGKTVSMSQMTWEFVDSTIASFDKNTGKITGLKEGTTDLVVYIDKANYPNVKDSVQVRVTLGTVDALKKDTTHSLVTTSGDQKVYVKNSSGGYSVATYADYYTASAFYVESKVSYIYTGWQTIDGNTYFYTKDHQKVCGDQIIQGIKYHFTDDGILAMDTNGKRGIDVSVYQGDIDWNAVKNSGIDFVIIRVGFRGNTQGNLYEDSKFRTNISGATAAGLKVGVYFVTQAVNEAEAVEEASMVIGLVKNYSISYPIFIDTEGAGGNGRADKIDKATRTAVCKAFCQTIANSGYTAGVYASKSWWTNNIDYNQLNGYRVWLAQYASSATLNGRYDIWQHSSKGSVSGINGNVDLNISYMGY